MPCSVRRGKSYVLKRLKKDALGIGADFKSMETTTPPVSAAPTVAQRHKDLTLAHLPFQDGAAVFELNS